MNTSTPQHTGTFGKYLQRLGHSPSNIANHLATLKRLEEWCKKENTEMAQLNHTELLLFAKHCQEKGAGKITVNKYLLTARHWFDHLIEEGTTKENPARGLHIKGAAKKRLHNVFTPLELEGIYNRYCNKGFKSGRYSTLHARHSLEHARDKVIVGMLVYQGLRSDEIIHLRTGDVKLRKGIVEVPEVKGSNSREMKLEACQIMDMHHYMTEVRNELLNNTVTEKFFISGSIHNTLEKIKKQLHSIEPRLESLRQLRASTITKWLKLYNLRQVQHLAGHKWISSTEEYLQNEMEGLQEEINKFHPLG